MRNKQEKEKIKQAACWDVRFSDAPEGAMRLRRPGPELDLQPSLRKVKMKPVIFAI